MKINRIILLLVTIALISFTACNTVSSKKGTITHTVFFKLKHPQGSEAEKVFLEKAVALKSISTVMNMTCVKEIGKKNDFDWGLTMQFKNQTDYDTYSNHPDHVAFVENVWKKEVADFMEIDYIDAP
ncbi:Dabb family protein [Galbibacter pacificus]|uniref:Dabb family protein n=1 Tax=Galbibacter pacificus TaxID=2996052 RepID=A0ABT6FV63_9FLAO|nr:Dabb family protein [Galbibacter pacificus]MDG3583918.1 Dabb family protein [Galbibacter pacificus]MDG3587164.1 Dabb family protein [Galbibacter pacificus]